MKSIKPKINPSDHPVNYTNFHHNKNNIPNAAYTRQHALRKTVNNPHPEPNPAPQPPSRALTTAKQPPNTTNIPTPATAEARETKNIASQIKTIYTIPTPFPPPQPAPQKNPTSFTDHPDNL